MKNLLIASMIAFAAASTFAIPSDAAPQTSNIQQGEFAQQNARQQNERTLPAARASDRDCSLMSVVQWQNHHKVLKQVRMCD